jgi:LysM domain-containing protein
MTVPVGTDAPSPPPIGPAPARGASQPERPRPSARDAVATTCPYLSSVGGSWRAAVPNRDHRCAAMSPPAALPTDKQRRHCLSSDHVDCPTYRAARTARAASLAFGADPALIEIADRRRRPVARTAPVVLEPAGLVDQAMRLQFDRAPGQVALVGLMIVAFAIVAIARFSAGGPAASPLPSVIAGASATPSRSITPTVSPSPIPSPSAAVGSPVPSFRTTYTVKKDDTLTGIAQKFGTTAAKIKTANGLTSNTLKVGQVLKIP